MKNIINATLVSFLSMLTIGVLFIPAQAKSSSYAECAAITNNQQRLQCFDQVAEQQATPAISSRPAQQTPNVVTRTNTQDPATFGMPAQRPTSEDNEKPSIDVVLTSWSKNIYGKIRFVTEDGQVWMQTDSTLVRISQDRVNATISEGLFGGYRLKIDGKRNLIRVKRLR